jgi:hypothetical protein
MPSTCRTTNKVALVWLATTALFLTSGDFLQAAGEDFCLRVSEKVCSRDDEALSSIVLEGVRDSVDGVDRCNADKKDCREECRTDYYLPMRQLRTYDPERETLRRDHEQCNNTCTQKHLCCVSLIKSMR